MPHSAFLMNRIFIFWSYLFLFFILILPAIGQQKTGYLVVSKVVDGDTFWVINSKGNEEKIRLIGVNTPEARATGRTQVEYFGKESSNYVKSLLSGRRVRLEFDVEKFDRYKRTLAYVYLEDGRFLNALLIKEGYASVATYPPNVKYASLFTELEREARKKGKGLWAK
jgi:micrococcal nuclease